MARSSIPILTLTKTATAAVTKFRAVKYSGVQCDTQGERVLGIAQATAASGDAFAVAVKGTSIAEAGAAITAGQRLRVDAQGRVIAAANFAVANPTVNAGATAVTSTAANGAIVTQGALSGAVLPEHAFATALEDASAAGKFLEILLD